MNTSTDAATTSEHEDVHVEIEHIPEDGGVDSEGEQLECSPNGPPIVTASGTPYNPLGKVQLYTRVQGKRTVILPHQKKILEEFYKTGMVSASHNLHHLHEAAADQTGLELYVIKNWVRNRRRPSAAQKRQDITELSNLTQPPLTTIQTLPNVTTVTIPTPHSVVHTPPTLVIPDAKRPCLDGLINSDPIGKSFLVKVRIADSGESDFVEVDVHSSSSYQEVLRSCCEELEVSLDEVSKLRKLPNVLVRKDRDIARLDNGQELELVLKGPSSMPLMTINPFSANPSSVQLIPIINTDNNLLSLDHGGQPGEVVTNNHT